MYRNWASDPEVTEFLTWPAHTGIDVTEKVLESWISRYEDGAYFNWAVLLKGSGDVIGNIAVVRLDEGTETAEIGYCLGKRFWGQGIMPEALKAVTDYLFDRAGLNRITAYHDIRNQKSGRVMEKAGMKREGVLRQAKKNNTGIHDAVIYGIVYSDRIPHRDYVSLFHEMHPGFFDRDYIRAIPEDEIFKEMILDLKSFDPHCYEKHFGPEVSFGYYEGEPDELYKAVARVEPDWVRYYNNRHRVYCGFFEGRIASFCMAEDMGIHRVGSKKERIGGPGCVGTLPEFRRRGIGLTMVRNVTAELAKEGYDYSYIHYTAVDPWYAGLGYKTILKWNSKGIID